MHLHFNTLSFSVDRARVHDIIEYLHSDMLILAFANIFDHKAVEMEDC